jgi:hypothetical protein
MTLTALGNLNPPGHVLPTDHVYFYAWDLASGHAGDASGTRAVYAPATASLFLIVQQGPDYKLMFRATENFYYYLGHVVPTVPLAIGQVFQAGAQIGVTDPGGTLDLGAFDMTATHDGFVSMSRYPTETQYYVSPWTYFTPALQAQVYPHVYRAPAAADKDGKIDFGVGGTLAGDWFIQGMPADSSYAPYGWTRTISFAYDYYDPSQRRISIGGTIGPAGVWGIDASAPAPESVTAASGVVSYSLYFTHDAQPRYGTLLVQMLDAATIKVELFVGTSAAAGQFDASAVTFVR